MTVRQAGLKRVAHRLDMDFTLEDEWSQLTLLKDFKLFRRGGRKRIRNIMQRKSALHDMDIRIFDYSFKVSSGNHSRTFKQTVFFVESKMLGLPQLLMKPETFFHRVAAFLGFEDIDFDNYPKFSDKYHLTGEDEEYIRSSLNDEFLTFFSLENGWHLEGLNYYFILYKFNKIIAPTHIERFHHKGLKIVDMLKQEPLI